MCIYIYIYIHTYTVIIMKVLIITVLITTVRLVLIRSNAYCQANDSTIVHEDDYVCICDDGFEEKIEDGGTNK